MKNKKLKLTYIITKSEIGGAQSHLVDIADNFKDRGHQVNVITGEKGWLTDELTTRHVPWEILSGLKNTYNPFKLLFLVLILHKKIRRDAPDIIHGHSSIAGLISRLASIRTASTSIFTMHGCPYSKAYPFYHRMLSWFFEWIINHVTNTQTIYVSEFDKNYSKSLGVCAKKYSVIYNGVDELDDRNFQKKKLPIKVLMTARFQYPKEHETVVKAAEILKNESFQFYFIGDGPLKDKVEILAKNLNLNNIYFLGSIKEAKKHAKDYDVFLLSSWAEGLPISIIEAMSSSLPIIATDVGGISEIIINEQNGFLINPGNPNEIAFALLRLNNFEQINLMGKVSKEIFKSNFSRDQMIKKLEDLYLSS